MTQCIANKDTGMFMYKGDHRNAKFLRLVAEGHTVVNNDLGDANLRWTGTEWVSENN